MGSVFLSAYAICHTLIYSTTVGKWNEDNSITALLAAGIICILIGIGCAGEYVRQKRDAAAADNKQSLEEDSADRTDGKDSGGAE